MASLDIGCAHCQSIEGIMTATDQTPAPETMTPPQAEEFGALAFAGKHWGLLLSFGIVLSGIGVAMMAWPQATVGVVALLFGVSLLVSGVFSIVASFTQPDVRTSARVLTALSGAISLALGMMCFRGIFQAAAILALFIGLGWLFRGVFDLVSGIGAKGVPGRGWVIASGVIGVIAGLTVLAWPAITLPALAWIGGLSLLFVGVLQIFASFSLRKAGRQAQIALETPVS